MQININEFYMSFGLSLKCYLSALTNKSRKTAWGIAVICSQALAMLHVLHNYLCMLNMVLLSVALELQHQETYYADL